MSTQNIQMNILNSLSSYDILHPETDYNLLTNKPTIPTVPSLPLSISNGGTGTNSITGLVNNLSTYFGNGKTQQGSYIGNGKFGELNPNSLMFSFKPQIVYIFNNSITGFITFNILKLTEDYEFYGYGFYYEPTSATDVRPKSYNHYAKIIDNNLSWYCKDLGESYYSPLYFQLNNSNTIYYWIAIG